MKTFHKILLLAAFMVAMTGCTSTKIPQTPDVNLPIVNNIKTISGTTEVGLEWPSFSGNNAVLGYYIYRSDPVSGAMNLIADIDDRFSTHYVDTKLAPETSYKYSIKTYGSSGISNNGQVVVANTAKLLDSVPFARAIYGLPERVKLIWRPHPDLRVASYVIERKKDGSSSWSKIAQVDGRLSAEYIDKGVDSGAKYEYRIFVKTASGEISKPSGVLPAQTKELPQSVQSVQATTNLPKKIIINWTPISGDDFSHYKIYSSRSEYLLFTQLGETTASKFEDLINDNGTVRYYKVTAIDKDGLEGEKQEGSAKGQTLSAPNAPVLNSAFYRDGQVKLTWAASDERTKSYIVERSDSWVSSKKFDGIGVNFMDDRDVEVGKSYSYKVYGVDEFGISSKGSNSISVEVN